MPAEPAGRRAHLSHVRFLLALTAFGCCLAAPAQDTSEVTSDIPRMISTVKPLKGAIQLPVIDAATVDVGERTVLLGGMTRDFSATPAIQIRRPDGEWQPVGNQMVNPRIAPDAITLPDGRIFVWGGQSGSARGTLTNQMNGELLNPRIAGSARLVDPPADTDWETASRPCLLQDGTIAIAAGRGIHRFDPRDQTWLDPILTSAPLDQPALCSLDTMRLLLVSTDSTAGGAQVIEVDVEQGTLERWTRSIPHPVPGTRLLRLPDERVLAVTWFEPNQRRSSRTWLLRTDSRTIEPGLNQTSIPSEADGAPTWIAACPNGGDVLVLMTTESSGEDQVTAFLLRSQANGFLRPWRLSTPPPGRLQMLRAGKDRQFELLGGYRYIDARQARDQGVPEGPRLSSDTVVLDYGTGPIGD
jgi:hypothetical protein